MFINAEIGRVFQSDDVTVKVVGQNRLEISAQRQEQDDAGTLNASISRQFHLPDKILPKTIQAGLTNDGVLKIAAVVDSDVTLVTDGRVHIELTKGSDVHENGR